MHHCAHTLINWSSFIIYLFYYSLNSRLKVLKNLFRALLPIDNYRTNVQPPRQKQMRQLFFQKFPGFVIIRLNQVLRYSLTNTDDSILPYFY